MFISPSPQLYEETGLGGARLLVGHSRLWATQPQAVSSVGHLAPLPNPLHHPDPQCLAPCMTYLFPPPVSPELLHSPFPPFSPPATSATPGGSHDNPTCLKSLLSWRGPCQPSSALEPGPERRGQLVLVKEQETWAESLSCSRDVRCHPTSQRCS